MRMWPHGSDDPAPVKGVNRSLSEGRAILYSNLSIGRCMFAGVPLTVVIARTLVHIMRLYCCSALLLIQAGVIRGRITVSSHVISRLNVNLLLGLTIWHNFSLL